MRIRQYAYFCVSSQTTHAEEMTSRIGLAPDETTTRGSRQAGDIVLPADHSWSVYATEQARPVDEQVSELVARLLPCRAAIAALINDPKANCSAQINVVRRFNDPDGEEENEERVGSPVGTLDKLSGQHQLLAWHLDHEVLAFLMSVAAEIDVDEYDMQP